MKRAVKKGKVPLMLTRWHCWMFGVESIVEQEMHFASTLFLNSSTIIQQLWDINFIRDWY